MNIALGITGSCFFTFSSCLSHFSALNQKANAGGAPAVLSNENFSSLAIHRRSYEAIRDEMFKLEKNQRERVEVVTYGQSVLGRPLTVLKVFHPEKVKTGSAKEAVVISETIHGDEYLNITDQLPGALMNLADRSAFSDFIESGGVAYFIPVMNPDGYEMLQRRNARGIDLNRSFPVGQSPRTDIAVGDAPETYFWRHYLEKDLRDHQKRLALSMEYHCCSQGLIHPWNFAPVPLDAARKDDFQKASLEVTKYFDLKVGTARDIAGYSASGGSDDFYLDRFNATAFSFEGRSRGLERRALFLHASMWNDLFASLNHSRQQFAH